MAKTRAKSQLYIPDDWDGQTYLLALACVPDSPQWRAVFSGAISQLARGRSWDAETGNIKDTVEIGSEIWESVNMNCLDVFEEISASLKVMAEKDGCCPADVTSEPPLNPPGLPWVFDGQGPTPGLYPTWESVKEMHCAFAQVFYEDMLNVLTELDQFGSLSIGISGAALAAVLALVSAPWVIAVGLVATVTALLTDASITQVRQEFILLKQEWTCAITEAPTVEAAIAALHQVVDQGISNALGRTLLKSVIGENWINEIWDLSGSETIPVHDTSLCDNCGPKGGCSQVEFNHGVLVNGDPLGAVGTQFTVSTTFRGTPFTYDRVQFTYNCNVELSVDAYTDWVGGDVDSGDRVSTLDNTITYSGGANDPPPQTQTFCGSRWSFGSDNAPQKMTVTFGIVSKGTCT